MYHKFLDIVVNQSHAYLIEYRVSSHVKNIHFHISVSDDNPV